jgi:hypothetical protein
VKLDEGAPVVAVLGVDALYHLPAPERHERQRRSWGHVGVVARPLASAVALDVFDDWPTLCGLAGALFVLGGPMRDRRCCAICRVRSTSGYLTVEGVYR